MSDKFPGNPFFSPQLERYAHSNDGAAMATLALAFEQRTANLIAVYNGGRDHRGIKGVDYNALGELIATRLHPHKEG